MYTVKSKEHVRRIIDGDTFETARGPVRLADVNAPKLRDPKGKQAKKDLEDLIGGKTVSLEVMRYRYGRRVATVKKGRTSINKIMQSKL